MKDAFLHLVHANSKIYFVQAFFESNMTCKLVMTDVRSCWEGFVSENDIDLAVDETGFNRRDYCVMMKSALTGIDYEQEFEYSINEQSKDEATLKWKKVKSDVKFCLGTISMKKVEDHVSTVKNILMSCSNTLLNFNSSKVESDEGKAKLEKKYLTSVAELKKCCDLKENLEVELMSKFVLIINEKKQKIRALQQQITDYQTYINKLQCGDKVMETQKEFPSVSKSSKTVSKKTAGVQSPLQEDDSFVSGPILPKRRRFIKPLRVDVSPIKTDNHPPPSVVIPDINVTTSSDSTLDVNELLEDI